MPNLRYLEPRRFFHHKLVLNQWLLSHFAIDALEEHTDGNQVVRPLFVLAKSLRNVEGGLGADRHHRFLHALLSHWQQGWVYSEQQLKQFDANIVDHLDAINKDRTRKIDWKYFQWLSLLFVEIYLYEYFNDKKALLSGLNQQLQRFNQHFNEKCFLTGFNDYLESDLNKICLQNATGSGKTLLMHVNILQFKYYAKRFGKTEDYGQIIVISPNERLTDQHMQELDESGFKHSERLVQGGDLIAAGRKALDIISLTEITKLADEQGKKQMAVDSFGDANLLLVDEGHRGLGNAQSGSWLRYRNKMSGNGFTFEYSATFKEAVVASKDREVEETYAKSILFDYGYRYFYEDGYGKDYRIFNLPNDAKNKNHQHYYLTAALLSFYQQCLLYSEKKHDFHVYNLAAPLWVFVGASVIKDNGETETKKNYDERASDVAEILKFMGWFLGSTPNAIDIIDVILSGNAKKSGLLDSDGRDIFGSSFPYIKEQGKAAKDIYGDICRLVFQADGGGSLVVERITGDSGELLLKVGDTDTPFGLINVGDAKGLADHLDAMVAIENIDYIDVKKSEFASPLFANVVNENSPINILLGSKKFIEGWNCWRVSSMGLMNTGKKEGSQIVQLFGRGVRLKGRDMSLMRSSRYQTGMAPKNIYLLETLNVFGVGAEFIAQFRDFLADEGLPGNENPFIAEIKLNTTHDMGKRLKILRPKVRKDSNEQYSFPKNGPLVLFGFGDSDNEFGLTPDIIKHNRKVVADHLPNMAVMLADEIQDHQGIAETAIPAYSHQFDDLHLAFIREDLLYLGLVRYTQSRGYANLLIEKTRLKTLLAADTWYEVLIPDNQWSMNAKNMRLWQEIALELLCLLSDKIYNYHRRSFLEPRLELVTLDKANDNLPTDDTYQIITDASMSSLVDDIRELKKAFEENNEDEFDNGHESIVGTNLNIHLYNPLLCAKSDRISIQPVGLIESEFQFVQDLKKWLERRADSLKETGEALYLLRNLVHGGVGFFEAGGFYPDFILWRVWEEGSNVQQRIVFIDPHGLQHEGQGSDKIEFSKNIKDVQKRMNNEVGLESVILSSPTTSKSVISNRWGLTEQALADKHVFFMSDGGYLDQLMDLVTRGS